MPDCSVVKCSTCGFHSVLVQVVPVTENYFICEQAECSRYQPARVVFRSGLALRSYDCRAMKQQARELNAISERTRGLGSISRQKVRLLDHISVRAMSRWAQSGQLSSRSSIQAREQPLQIRDNPPKGQVPPQLNCSSETDGDARHSAFKSQRMHLEERPSVQQVET